MKLILPILESDSLFIAYLWLYQALNKGEEFRSSDIYHFWVILCTACFRLGTFWSRVLLFEFSFLQLKLNTSLNLEAAILFFRAAQKAIWGDRSMRGLYLLKRSTHKRSTRFLTIYGATAHQKYVQTNQTCYWCCTLENFITNVNGQCITTALSISVCIHSDECVRSTVNYIFIKKYPLLNDCMPPCPFMLPASLNAMAFKSILLPWINGSSSTTHLFRIMLIYWVGNFFSCGAISSYCMYIDMVNIA